MYIYKLSVKFRGVKTEEKRASPNLFCYVINIRLVSTRYETDREMKNGKILFRREAQLFSLACDEKILNCNINQKESNRENYNTCNYNTVIC